MLENLKQEVPDIQEPFLPAPKELLDRSSSSHLRRFIVEGMTHEGQAPISDLGNIYEWDAAKGIWRKRTADNLEAAVLDWDGVARIRSINKDGEETSKPLALSMSATEAAVKATLVATRKRGAFDNAPPGIALADDFLMVQGDKLARERLGAHHLQTFAHPFTYLEAKSCKTPMFDRFMREQVRDEDALFLQEWLGAALLGIATRYHRIVLLHGPRGCGKSTLIDIMQSVFPEGSVSNIPLQKWGDDTYLCHLAGARLNVVSELPDDRIRQLDRLKSIPEGATLQVRDVYASAFTFQPKAAHIFACNSIPDMPGFQDAVGDRLAPILMDSRGQGSVRGTGKDDRDLKAKIVSRELPGIVYWAIEGARRLLDRGKLEIPATIQDQLNELARDADAIGAWLNERTDMGRTGQWTKASDLHDDFKKWCESSRHAVMTSTSFGKRLKQRSGENGKPIGWKPSNGIKYQLSLLHNSSPF